MHRWLIALVVASSAASASLAEPLFHASSPRELAYQVDTVVVARSTDAGQPTRFKVERCLKGKLQAGQVIQVEGLLPLFAGATELTGANLSAACLFLKAQRGGAGFRLAPTGIICLSRSHGVFRPMPAAEAGVFHLQPSARGEQWPELLARVDRDIAEVNRLQRARDLTPARGRNQALLDWIELHRRELQDSTSSRRPGSADLQPQPTPAEIQDRHERGWGDLERLPFLWVLDSGALTDCCAQHSLRGDQRRRLPRPGSANLVLEGRPGLPGRDGP